MEQLDETLDDIVKPKLVVSKRGKGIFYAVLSLIVTVIIITCLTEAYGIALYIGIPLTIGFILGFKNKISFQFIKTSGKVFLTVMLLSWVLIALKIEGAICIIMIAVPLFVFIYIGSGLGYLIYKHNLQKSKTIVSLLLLINPSFCLFDSQQEMNNHSVSSQIEIVASKEEIWNTLVHPVQYNEHPNLLFQYGVNYPKTMEIVQKNDTTTLLRCNLRNGNIDLNVNKFYKDSLMQFEINEPVIPIKELTVYKDVHTPHTNDKYFKLHYGEFEIKAIDKNKSVLVATSNFSYRFSPDFYWKWWSCYLMNKMHNHVLEDIKLKSEQLHEAS